MRKPWRPCSILLTLHLLGICAVMRAGLSRLRSACWLLLLLLLLLRLNGRLPHRLQWDVLRYRSFIDSASFSGPSVKYFNAILNISVIYKQVRATLRNGQSCDNINYLPRSNVLRRPFFGPRSPIMRHRCWREDAYK